jgi:hypothetical protein
MKLLANEISKLDGLAELPTREEPCLLIPISEGDRAKDIF